MRWCRFDSNNITIAIKMVHSCFGESICNRVVVPQLRFKQDVLVLVVSVSSIFFRFATPKTFLIFLEKYKHENTKPTKIEPRLLAKVI